MSKPLTFTAAQMVTFAKEAVDVALGEVVRQAGGGSHVDEAMNMAYGYIDGMMWSLARLAAAEQQEEDPPIDETSVTFARGEADGRRGHPPAELTPTYLAGYKKGSS